MPFEPISLLIEIFPKERNIQVFNDAKICILRIFSGKKSIQWRFYFFKVTLNFICGKLVQSSMVHFFNYTSSNH